MLGSDILVRENYAGEKVLFYSAEILFPSSVIFQNRVLLTGPLLPNSEDLLVGSKNEDKILSLSEIDSYNWILLDLFFNVDCKLSDAEIEEFHLEARDVLTKSWQLHFSENYPERILKIKQIDGEDFGLMLSQV